VPFFGQQPDRYQELAQKGLGHCSGALEIVLDRGLVDDWFSSTFIVGFAVMAAVAFLLMIPWELSRRDPMIDIGMVATRQFGACFAVMLATGAILYSTTQFLPLLVQQYFGYTATWAGLVLTPGGLVRANQCG
jgi:DHA2 family multidrug resistance protein